MNIFLLSFAAYGFATAVQMIRGTRFNKKPWNCKFCLSFWIALIWYLYEQPFDFNHLVTDTIYSFTVACISYFLMRIDDKLQQTGLMPPDFG